MNTYPRARLPAQTTIDRAALHKHAVPGVPGSHAREALQIGLSLQAVAVDLNSRHCQEYRQDRQINRLRHIVWWLCLLAAILVTVALAPVGDWWQAVTDASAGKAPAP